MKACFWAKGWVWRCPDPPADAPALSPQAAVSGRCVTEDAPSLAHGPQLPEDQTALPSITAATGMLWGIWLAFKGQVFMGLRAQHLPSSSYGMFIYFLVFLVAGKYEPKTLNLTFSFSSMLQLYSDVCATNNRPLRHFWLQLLKKSPHALIFQRNNFQPFDISKLIVQCTS